MTGKSIANDFQYTKLKRKQEKKTGNKTNKNIASPCNYHLQQLLRKDCANSLLVDL